MTVGDINYRPPRLVLSLWLTSVDLKVATKWRMRTFKHMSNSMLYCRRSPLRLDLTAGFTTHLFLPVFLKLDLINQTEESTITS